MGEEHDLQQARYHLRLIDLKTIEPVGSRPETPTSKADALRRILQWLKGHVPCRARP